MRAAIIISFWVFAAGLLVLILSPYLPVSYPSTAITFLELVSVLSFLAVLLFCAMGVMMNPRLVRNVLLAMAGIACLLGFLLMFP
jgi:hypothetical protein